MANCIKGISVSAHSKGLRGDWHAAFGDAPNSRRTEPLLNVVWQAGAGRIEVAPRLPPCYVLGTGT
jgi:hypothetical protein